MVIYVFTLVIKHRTYWNFDLEGQNNRDLNQGVLHKLSRTNSGLTHKPAYGHTNTQRHTQATTIPKGKNWPFR